jgi:hypothetical protein
MVLKIIMVVAATLAIGTTGSLIGASDDKATTAVAASTAVTVAQQCPDARRGLTYYRLRWSSWRTLRGIEQRDLQLVQPRGCAHTSWAAKVWRQKARDARLSYAEWRESRWRIREQRTWQAAVEHVQRAYPDTAAWLLSCSASEGSHGLWVPNRQGSGAGGWLQFMESTFWRMWAAAREDVLARGFTVEGRMASWYSRTGQALAGAWGVTHGRRHEWSGSGC